MKLKYLLIGVVVLLAVGVLTVSGYAELDPKTIAAIWLFDESDGNIAKDSSGNGNDGTLINGPTRVDGKFGKALNFDGVNDYVNIDYDSSLKLANDGAICLWFKPSELKADTHSILSYGGKSYSTGNLLNQYGASMFYGYWKTPGPSITFDPAFFIDEWAHIAMTNDNGSLKFYLNGEEKSTGTSGGEITDNLPTYIGATPSGWSVSGIIDDVVILNAALEEDDVVTIMNEGLTESLSLAVDFSGKLTAKWSAIKAHLLQVERR